MDYDKELKRLQDVKEQYTGVDIGHEVRVDIARFMERMTVEELIQLKCTAAEIVRK